MDREKGCSAMVGGNSSLWFRNALLPHGWASGVRLTLRDGLTAAVETKVEKAVGEESYAAAVPGIPNLHSHAFQRAMAGLTERRGRDDDDFWSWREAMYRFVDRIGPEDLESIAAQAFVEMLESGFTRVGEFHYLHHDPTGAPYGEPAQMAAALVSAAELTHIGLTLLPVFYAHSGFGGADPALEQRRFVSGLDSFAVLMDSSADAISTLPDGVLGVAPHSLRAVTGNELAVVSRMGGGPVHIHVAEQGREVDDCLAWSGRRPVEWLLDAAPVDSRWCLVHATHMTADEVQKFASTGAVAGLCPITEANLGDGIFAAKEYIACGGAFGVGSDSNVLIDAVEELRLLEYSQRLIHRQRNVMAGASGFSTGLTLLQGALGGGAQALGSRAALEPGASADFLSLNLEHPSLADRAADQLADAWIFAVRSGGVEHVWRRGRRVVEGGRHLRRAEIGARYRSVLQRLLS
jgi:formimidoylglutamate deiminase